MIDRLKRFTLFTLILIIILGTLYFFLFEMGKDSDKVTASGTVEVVELVVVADLGGRIAQVLADEGDLVQAGDVLVRFEDENLKAQYDQAKANLEEAQSNYALIAAQPLNETRQVAIAVAQIELLSAKQALADMVDNADLERAVAQKNLENVEQALEDLLNPQLLQDAALQEIAASEQAIDRTEKNLTIVSSPAPQSAIDQAYANMLMAENKLKKTIDDTELAKQKLKKGPQKYWPENYKIEYYSQFRKLIKNLEIKLAWDRLAYQNATEKYNELLKPIDPIEVALAQAELAKAQAKWKQARREYERIKDGPSLADIAVLEARIDLARQEYEDLKSGPDPMDLAIAQTRLQLAESNLILAQSDTIQEQLALAQSQIEVAKTELSLIQTQLEKLVITAPVNGTVLDLFVKAGEVVVPGEVVLIMANLEHVNITVFLSEHSQTAIRTGDQAVLMLDSVPNQVFTATITRIVDQKKYTQSSYQPAEESQSSLFEVALSVSNPEGKLKPGMSGKVIFGE